MVKNKTNTKSSIQFHGKNIDVEDYITDTFLKAEDYSRTALFLIKSLKTLDDVYILESSSYLAAHSAELYLKAAIVSYGGSDSYEEIRKIKNSHDLLELLNLLLHFNSDAVVLSRALADLNKYSGDKVRFAEKQRTELQHIEYGSSDISKIEEVKKFCIKILE